MDALVWSGFILGFVGGLHCLGMCGPIALALPAGANSRAGFLLGRVVYNAGRVLTYVALGLVSGVIGRTLVLAGFQRTLSWVAGVLILAAVLVPRSVRAKLVPGTIMESGTRWMQRLWQRYFTRSSHLSLLVIGLLNGLLPCGLVYVALGAAAVTGSPLHAALYMLLFGAGTIPVMLSTSVFGPVVGVNLRRRLSRLLPAAAVALGLILILRGMSLGIPYVSPKLDHQASGDAPVCH